jgi:hypothetical protein
LDRLISNICLLQQAKRNNESILRTNVARRYLTSSRSQV